MSITVVIISTFYHSPLSLTACVVQVNGNKSLFVTGFIIAIRLSTGLCTISGILSGYSTSTQYFIISFPFQRLNFRFLSNQLIFAIPDEIHPTNFLSSCHNHRPTIWFLNTNYFPWYWTSTEVDSYQFYQPPFVHTTLELRQHLRNTIEEVNPSSSRTFCGIVERRNSCFPHLCPMVPSSSCVFKSPSLKHRRQQSVGVPLRFIGALSKL